MVATSSDDDDDFNRDIVGESADSPLQVFTDGPSPPHNADVSRRIDSIELVGFDSFQIFEDRNTLDDQENED
jgi:hypothetical protein